MNRGRPSNVTLGILRHEYSDRRSMFHTLRMVSDAECLGDFKTIIAYDLSRFGRMDSDEIGFYRHLLKRAGVQIRFSNENDGGDNETGEIIRPVLQAQKRQYLRQISRDTLRGQLQAARAGWVSGRAAPFGFDRVLVDENGQQRQRLKRGESYAKSRSWHVTLAPSDTPGEVDALRWMFDTYLKSEVGCREIARRLNEKGIKSPHDGQGRAPESSLQRRSGLWPARHGQLPSRAEWTGRRCGKQRRHRCFPA